LARLSSGSGKGHLPLSGRIAAGFSLATSIRKVPDHRCEKVNADGAVEFRRRYFESGWMARSAPMISCMSAGIGAVKCMVSPVAGCSKASR